MNDTRGNSLLSMSRGTADFVSLVSHMQTRNAFNFQMCTPSDTAAFLRLHPICNRSAIVCDHGITALFWSSINFLSRTSFDQYAVSSFHHLLNCCWLWDHCWYSRFVRNWVIIGHTADWWDIEWSLVIQQIGQFRSGSTFHPSIFASPTGSCQERLLSGYVCISHWYGTLWALEVFGSMLDLYSVKGSAIFVLFLNRNYRSGSQCSSINSFWFSHIAYGRSIKSVSIDVCWIRLFEFNHYVVSTDIDSISDSFYWNSSGS